jgi:hypothetical protein
MASRKVNHRRIWRAFMPCKTHIGGAIQPRMPAHIKLTIGLNFVAPDQMGLTISNMP